MSVLQRDEGVREGERGEGVNVDTLVRLLVQQAASMPINGLAARADTHTHTHCTHV